MNIGSILAGGDGTTSLSPVYEMPISNTVCENLNEFSALTRLNYNTFDHQRPLRKQKVDNYAQQMLEGDWKPGADGGITLARTGDGEWELMNGQHRLHAVVKACQSNPALSIPFQIIYYTFKSERDKYAFFASIDQGAKRTEADALLAMGAKETLYGVDKRTITTATSALKTIEIGFKLNGGNRHTIRQNTNTTGGVKRAIEAFADPIKATANGLLGNKVLSRKTMNASAFGIVLLTYTYAPEEAHEFWPEVIDPNTLTKGTPQYALHHYLLTHAPTEEGTDTYSFCIANAWNAYAEGRSIEILKRGNGQSIMRLACTPFDGKNVNAGREIIAARLASHGGKQ